MALARRALARDLPLLGICRGMQLLNAALGGTLDQHLPESLGSEAHRRVPSFSGDRVRSSPARWPAPPPGPRRYVFSHHHQGVAELGEGLVVGGHAEEDGIVEAIELPGSAPALPPSGTPRRTRAAR
ncbi:MAG: gamma-glutamyl-gamma-aminobutyrate hydrolase family protein [Solirubrobacterales bacterium]